MYSWKDYLDWSGMTLVKRDGTLASGPMPSPNRICTDSRTIEKGDIYLPLVGESFDGHDYIPLAIEKGAFSVISARSSAAGSNDRVAYLDHGTTLDFLQNLSTGYRRALTKTKFIAITGSVGKTSVKSLLSHLLSLKHVVHFAPGSFNNEIGVPKTLLSCPLDAEYCILEFGARKVDDIKFLMGIAEPDVGVCLNALSAHLGIFGSTENLRRTKLQIIGNSSPNANRIVLRDDEKLYHAAKALSNDLFSFGKSQESDVRIVADSWDREGRQIISLESKNGKSSWAYNQGHDSYAINTAAAVAIMASLGLDERLYEEATSTYLPPEGRYSVKKSATQTLINDAYNANPDSMRSGLATLKKGVPDTESLTIVLGDMLELGDKSNSLHEQLGEEVSEMFQHAKIFFVGDESAFFRQGCPKTRNSFPNLKSATPEFWEDLRNAKTLYLKGSNGVGLYKIEATLKGDP